MRAARTSAHGRKIDREDARRVARPTALRALLSLAVVSIAAATPAVTSSSGATSTKPACGPRDPTVAQVGPVRVFSDQSHHYIAGSKIPGFVMACDRATKAMTILTSAAGKRTLLMPGSVSIAGNVVGYGYDDLGDGAYGPPYTWVEAVSLGPASGSITDAFARPTQPGLDPVIYGEVGKVVRTAVMPDGALVWTSCESGETLGADLAVGRRARCQRAGSFAWVFTAKGTEQAPVVSAPTRLDHGGGIAPISLRVTGSVISWIDHGKRLTAELG
jgi:hypothetical protein